MRRARWACPTVPAASLSDALPTSPCGTPTIHERSAMRWAACLVSAWSRTARSSIRLRCPPLRDKLLGWLDGERERQLEFLRAFTRIDTCNPPGDTRQAADVFRRFLDAEGISHRTEAPQATMPNLIASFEGARPGRHLVLNGHLDVFP